MQKYIQWKKDYMKNKFKSLRKSKPKAPNSVSVSTKKKPKLNHEKAKERHHSPNISAKDIEVSTPSPSHYQRRNEA